MGKLSTANARFIELLGTRQFFLAESAQTNGKTLVLEMRLPPGATLAKHRHEHEDEAFYVTAGQLRVGIEGEENAVLGPGDFIFAPRHRVHFLACEGEKEATLLGIAIPGANIAGMYEAIEQASKEGDVSPAELANICLRFDINFNV